MTVSVSVHSAGGRARPATLGELRRIPDFDARTASRSVKDEIRANLLRAIERGETLFPGVQGYEDTVIPQIVNALLSRHNFILLGLRGQAKSRILRGVANLLDAEIPVLAGSEINDDPLRPICRACARGPHRRRRRQIHRLLGCRVIFVTWKSWLLPM